MFVYLIILIWLLIGIDGFAKSGGSGNQSHIDPYMVLKTTSLFGAEVNEDLKKIFDRIKKLREIGDEKQRSEEIKSGAISRVSMSGINEQTKRMTDMATPELNKVDSKISQQNDRDKARNNRIGDFPDGSNEKEVQDATKQGKKLSAAHDQKVFEEDEKSAAEFLKRINQFVSDMEELTPYTVNG